MMCCAALAQGMLDIVMLVMVIFVDSHKCAPHKVTVLCSFKQSAEEHRGMFADRKIT